MLKLKMVYQEYHGGHLNSLSDVPTKYLIDFNELHA